MRRPLEPNLYTSVVTHGLSLSYAGGIYVQPRFPKLDDVRVLASSRLGVSVSEKVQVVTTVRFRFDEGSPDGVGRADLQLVYRFAVAF